MNSPEEQYEPLEIIGHGSFGQIRKVIFQLAFTVDFEKQCNTDTFCVGQKNKGWASVGSKRNCIR